MNRLGTIKRNIEVSNEYEMLAKKDEEVAKILESSGNYRHAIYFYIQSMEKYIRSKIFSIVNPNLQYFREKNNHHSLEKAIDFLLEILTTDENVRETLRQQLITTVIGDINYRQLHNSLRYPFYSVRHDSYSVLYYSKEDCQFIQAGLNKLKKYLKDIDRIGNI